MSGNGTKENPFTHRGSDAAAARRMWCKCFECGKVAICTPEHDFYALKEGDPLRCERPCYWTWFHREEPPVFARPKVAVTPELELKCPFCQDEERDGVVAVVRSTPDLQPNLMHTMPTCAEWRGEEDPANFLASVRRRLGN